MDSQLSKAKGITEEEFRSCYPDVSIQHLSDRAALRVPPSIEKRPPIKTPAKALIMPKTPIVAKSPSVTKTPNTKSPQRVSARSNVVATPKVNPVPVVPKTPVVGKTPVAAKPTPNVTKPPVVAKTPVMVKPPVAAKTPVQTPALVKTPAAAAKASAKTPASLQKVIPPQKTPAKAIQNVVKPQTQSGVKTLQKTATTSSAAKDDSPDQSTMTVLTYHMPQATPTRSNQLTIEKIEQQQRIPVVLDTNNQVVLQQVINNGQLVLHNRVAPSETTLQSVVIGTTAVPQVVTPLPQVEITTSDPIQALQVTQQVTLFRPKGNTFTVEDVKKQISLNKQSAMTNVVSSTTNSSPAPVAGAAQSVQAEQKKVAVPARVQGVPQSPVRQSVRTQQKVVNYQSTRGQVKKVSPKREIPMQKVSPMQPPPVPPPELQFNNEEEVTTSEAGGVMQEPISETKVIVILPNGEKKRISISGEMPLNYTIQDLLTRIQVPITESMQHKLSAEICSSDENLQDADGGDGQWESVDAVEQLAQAEEEEAHKDTDATKSRKTKADSLTEEGPKKKKTCKRRKLDEPVCLTISDDEELLGLAHHAHAHAAEARWTESFLSDSNSQLSDKGSCDKEPVITNEMVAEMKYALTGGVDMEEQFLDNPSEEDKTYLQCRTVRIGSYKVVPKDKVLITPHGLKFTVPVLNSDQFVELKIMYNEVIKVLIHFGRQMPVLFFYTRPTAAAKIRRALKMTDKNGFYYDSTSSDETHRRITFLPDKIDEDCKLTLKTIFGDPENNVFAELTGKEANDILVKASPKEVQAFILKKQPNTQQQQQPVPFNGQNIQTIMVYPPPPEKGGIPINTEDYACLGEDQFLNDVIIDFYLKYVVEKTLSPEDRARTHVFSSFFYKRLTTKPPPKRKSMNPVENDPTASPAVKRHSRVKSWTKNVNLFTKDFIVIPINENSHWFLAIVCFPGLTGPVRFADNKPIDLPGRKKQKLDGKHTVTIGSTTITAVAPNTHTTLDVTDEGEDRDEADGEDEDMDVPDSEEDQFLKQTVPEVKEEEAEDNRPVTRSKRVPIKQPCILIFDSLAGASRARVVATLRDYLRVEYEAKNGEPRDFSGEIMKGTNVRCPQQTNYTDCGLYVLQYVEAFFQWPVTDYHIPIKQLQGWFETDIVSRKRYEIQQLLHRLMQEQSIDIEALNLPQLNLRPEGKLLVEYSGTEEEDDEDEEEEDEQMCEDEEDDMLDDDGEYNDEMIGQDEINEEMEEGEIGHHIEEDPDSFIDPNMDHDEHEMDEEEYGMEDEEDPQEDDLEDKELEDISLTPIGPITKDLKHFRIPRLIKSDNTYEQFSSSKTD